MTLQNLLAIQRLLAFEASRGLELGVAWLYAHDKAFKLPYRTT